MPPYLRVALWVAAALPRVSKAYNEMPQFLIVSSSVTHQIAYAPIPQEPHPPALELKTLITSGLTFPQGLAVDPWRRYLYVADPTLNKLVYYVLKAKGRDKLEVGKQQTAAVGTDAATPLQVRWVSVDNLGNVYFTVESLHRIYRITSSMLDRGVTTPEVVFEGSKTPSVNAPGGIAIDNYFVYWSNKLSQNTAGTIVRGGYAPETVTKALTDIEAKSYGVCLAVNNVFFTAETKYMYGVNRLGSGWNGTVAVSDQFNEARGCAYDGMGTVYVADKGNNAIYSFPGDMMELRESVPVSLTAYMQGAYGVSVYTVSESGFAFTTGPTIILQIVLALFTIFTTSELAF